jgi:hypothetical protein
MSIRDDSREDRPTDVGDDGDVPRDPLTERLGEGAEASEEATAGRADEEDASA